MSAHRKDVTELVPADFEFSPVWEYDLANEEDSDTAVIPVFDLPVDDLGNRVIGTTVRFANGQEAPATIACVDTKDPYATRHFIFVSIYKEKWLHLARYHDSWYDREGPDALAAALGLKVEDVFPIAYDIRAHCLGDPAALAGVIHAEPAEKLTWDELLKLIARGRKS